MKVYLNKVCFLFSLKFVFVFFCTFTLHTNKESLDFSLGLFVQMRNRDVHYSGRRDLKRVIESDTNPNHRIRRKQKKKDRKKEGEKEKEMSTPSCLFTVYLYSLK